MQEGHKTARQAFLRGKKGESLSTGMNCKEQQQTYGCSDSAKVSKRKMLCMDVIHDIFWVIHAYSFQVRTDFDGQS